MSKNELNKLKLTKDEWAELFSLSLYSLDLLLHDLSQPSVAIRIAAELMEDEVKAARSQMDSYSLVSFLQNIDDFHRDLSSASERLLDTQRRMRDFCSTRHEEPFLTRPSAIVTKAIEDSALPYEHQASPIVEATAESLTNLEIIYPTTIFEGVLTELFRNARKADAKRICLHWWMQAQVFKCEVHDDGRGFRNAPPKGYIPLDAILNSEMATGASRGLTIISRIMVRSKGLLLLSRSKRLGGALVHFEFPVFGYGIR
jgi:signal transduction histidine kinase